MYQYQEGMGRRAVSHTPEIRYRGVTIRLYQHRNRWKATFQLHGQKRRECYGPTEAAAQWPPKRQSAMNSCNTIGGRQPKRLEEPTL